MININKEVDDFQTHFPCHKAEIIFTCISKVQDNMIGCFYQNITLNPKWDVTTR